MRYYSLNQNAPDVTFQEAVVRGIAPDRGLYFPREIPRLPASFWNSLNTMAVTELALELMRPYAGESIPNEALSAMLAETLSFDFPLVELAPGLYSLELYHGPTMAFKDVGARFMAHCLGYFSRDSDREVTVLVATSGDTGGAVARGFLGVPGVRVVILYPEGKVSEVQERQLTTLGQNITALRIKGSFDDCQRMVKEAFLDADVAGARQLTSANSINVARWIPQMLYYVLAYRSLGPKAGRPVFSVPSGNFGNICAGMLAHKMGLPCRQFLAATNANDTVPRFMSGQQYEPHSSVATISNAMDVADPSNFVRVLQLFGNHFPELAAVLTSKSYTDEQTREAMRTLYGTYGYVADPHGAVGYLGLAEYLETHPGGPGIFLETAHPIKFMPEVERCLGITLELPPQIKEVMNKVMHAIPVAGYAQLKSFLLETE